MDLQITNISRPKRLSVDDIRKVTGESLPIVKVRTKKDDLIDMLKDRLGLVWDDSGDTEAEREEMRKLAVSMMKEGISYTKGEIIHLLYEFNLSNHYKAERELSLMLEYRILKKTDTNIFYLIKNEYDFNRMD